MRWIVGIDFVERSRGALHMAAWLRREARTEPQEFVGIHVLEERLRSMMLVPSIPDAPAASAEEVRRVAAASGVPDPLTEVSAVWAGSVEDGLSLAAAPSAMGLIIGRAAASGGRGLVRLGRVARRLLRSLTVPVMVVPPDLAIDDVGKGPVILATDLDPASTGAAKVARTLASALDRQLLVASIDATFHETAARAPISLLTQPHFSARTRAEVRGWMDANGLVGSQAEVIEGERVATLLDVGRRHDAPMIVCGSRGLSLRERLFASSTATALAGAGDRAVLVVPAEG